jgi:hypothetical protein
MGWKSIPIHRGLERATGAVSCKQDIERSSSIKGGEFLE